MKCSDACLVRCHSFLNTRERKLCCNLVAIMNRKNRVLHILWSGHAGGAERFVRDIVVHTNMTPFEHAVCFLSHGGSFAAAMEKSGAATYCLNMKTGFSVARGTQIRRLIKHIAPRIIQAHCRNYVASAVMATLSAPKKAYFEHGGDLIAEHPIRDVRFYNWFSRYYDLIMANSHYTRDSILELTDTDPQKVVVFYPGIDCALFDRAHRNDTLRQRLGFADSDTVIGTIGRLVTQKGIDDFIAVAAEVAKLHRSCRFVVVGEGHKRAELERMVKDHQIDVTFLGERLDIPSIMKMFDLFLFTPKWEPFGLVVLEAMAASVPVVGYCVPGMKELVERGGGVLVEKRDPLLLARTVVDILTNREQYSRLQHEGCTHVCTHFDIRKRVRALESLYMKLLSTT